MFKLLFHLLTFTATTILNFSKNYLLFINDFLLLFDLPKLPMLFSLIFNQCSTYVETK